MDPKSSILDPKVDQNRKPKIKNDSERKKPSQTPPKCLQEAPGRPNLVPKTAQEPPKRRPRRLKNRPRAAQEALRKRPTGGSEPDDTQERPQSRPKAPQTPSRPRFWTIWQRFSQDFGPCLGSKIQEHWIHSLSTIRLQCWGGLRPPRPPPASRHENWIHVLLAIRLQCWGGCAPPDPPVFRRPPALRLPLRGSTVAGTRLCRAENINDSLLT